MLPLEDRTPDTQYRDALRFILQNGELVKDTPQGVGALTTIDTPKLVFNLENGVPIITERSMDRFWRKAIDELFAFIRGARTSEELRAAGCNYWDEWLTKEKCSTVGLPEGDMGPAAYGSAFHNFPMPDGGSFNQFAHLIEQLRTYPMIRTHFITPWIPFWNGRGGNQKAVVSPCHGWIHCRVINGKLVLHMFQRSADMPIGVPSNMAQYAALTLVIADILGLTAWKYVHSFSDSHIYENQIPNVRELIEREPRPFPTLRLIRPVTDIFSVTSADFELTDYTPHPGMKIPVAV